MSFVRESRTLRSVVRVFTLRRYLNQVKRLLSADERVAMEQSIAADPLAYPVMVHTGGCRKARWARGNRGKSGGIRVVFYYYVSGEAIYMLEAFPKNEKENLTDADKNQLRKVTQAIGHKED